MSTPCVIVKVKLKDGTPTKNLIERALVKTDRYECTRAAVNFLESLESGAALYDEESVQVSVTSNDATIAAFGSFDGPKLINGGTGNVSLATVNDGFGAVGAPSTYALQAYSTITSTGSSVVTGDLGLSPGTSVTGFPPATLSGTSNVANAAAAAVKVQSLAVYNYIAGLAAGTDESGVDLGTLTLAPGTYSFTTSAQLTGTLVLDAGGNANAQWFFRIGTTLTTAAASVVSIINGGTAGNVFWQVGTSATLGASSTFKGNIFADSSISLGSAASVVGRLVALNGAVTMIGNTVTVTGADVSASAVGTLMNAGTGSGTLITGDGLRTIQELVASWNAAHPTNLINTVAGSTLIVSSGVIMALSGGGVGVPATYANAAISLADLNQTLTVIADQSGPANNVVLTANGTSTFQQLVTAASGVGKTYTVTAGGALIPKSGVTIAIANGADAVAAIIIDTVTL